MSKENHLRLLFFADTHLGFDYPIKPRIERRRRGVDFFANYQKVLDYAVRTRPDLVVHGGDFFFRSRVPLKVVNEAYQRLLEFAKSGIPIFIVPGNHERSRLPSVELIDHSAIHIFDKPRTFELKSHNVRIALSGFPCERGPIRTLFKDLLATTSWQHYSPDIRLLVIHQAVEGAIVGPSDYTFRNRSDTISMKDIPESFFVTLCGHIHRRQILSTGDGNRCPQRIVVYPGSTERTSFAERGEVKGFFELCFHQDNNGYWKKVAKRFLRLPARPMFDLTIDSDLDPNNLKSYILSRVEEIHEHAIVRLRLSDPSNHRIKEKLTARFLREVLPKTMNYQYGLEFYGNSHRTESTSHQTGL